MKLDNIEVSGFKSIKKLNLALRPLNVLIGANGAGKSNFLEIFILLNEFAKKQLQRFIKTKGGAETFLHFGQKNTNELIIKLKISNSKLNEYECCLIPTSKDTLYISKQRFQSEYGNFTDDGVYEETTLNDKEDMVLDDVAEFLIETLKSWIVYHFHDTSSTAKIKLKCEIDDNITLRPDASNLAAFLYFLKKRHSFMYQNIVDTVRLAAPFLDDFDLQPDRLNPKMISLEWRHSGSDAYFNADTLSDGTLRFISLATLLLQPNLPSIILLDEPELGLHPYAITLLAEMLQSAATKTQVIVSTQSVTLVNQFQPEDIIVVDRVDEKSKFRRLNKKDYKDWLNDYSLGELWEKNVLGGRP